MAFSLQQAYDAAPEGSTIQVPAGVLVTDDPGRNSVTIFGTKRMTFAAQGEVTHNSFVFTIKAPVTLTGPGNWKLHILRLGEGGDFQRGGAHSILVEKVKMDAFECVGAQATIRNFEIGPNVLCGPSGDPAACSPTGPEWERFYSPVGNGNQPFEPYIHNNQGGIPGEPLMEDGLIHEIQSKDAVRWHTGGMLIWNPPGGTIKVDSQGREYGQVTLRRVKWERCAVQGILVEAGDGIVIEDCVFGGSYEPFSNTGGQWVEAPDWTPDLSIKTTSRNIRVRRTKFCHGTRNQGTVSNVIFEDCDMGRADTPWGQGTQYIRCTNLGLGCSATPPPPPPPPPDGLTLRLVSQTQTKITLGWDPVDGAIGYRFQSAASAPKWSHTWDATRDEVTFAKGQGPYIVQALGVEDEDTYP